LLEVVDLRDAFSLLYSGHVFRQRERGERGRERENVREREG
jgi:ATP phosphoribosyltransferase regulatory subunit HisZ